MEKAAQWARRPARSNGPTDALAKPTRTAGIHESEDRRQADLINQDRKPYGPGTFLVGRMVAIPVIMLIVMVITFVTMFYFVFWRSGFRPPWWNDSDRPSSRPKDSETAIEILKKRYAKGEISREEFEQVKKELQG